MDVLQLWNVKGEAIRGFLGSAGYVSLKFTLGKREEWLSLAVMVLKLTA